MNKTIKETAEFMARDYIKDPDTKKIYWAPHDNLVLLVLIEDWCQDDGEILPVGFNTCSLDVEYGYVITELSQADFDKAMNGKFDSVPEFFKRLELIAEK